jgi:hypothetical protein
MVRRLIAPGIIWLPAIHKRSANEDMFIGTIRTTFTF